MKMVKYIKIHKGKFKDGKLEGIIKYYHSEGMLIQTRQGTSINEKLQGQGKLILYNIHGQKIFSEEGTFEKGSLNGLGKTERYSDSGILEETQTGIFNRRGGFAHG